MVICNYLSDTKQRHTSVRNYHSYAKYYVNTMIQRTISFLSGFSVHVNREAYKQYILFPYIDTRQLQNAASASTSRPPCPFRFCSSRCAPIRLRIDPIPAARSAPRYLKEFLCSYCLLRWLRAAASGSFCCFRQSLSTALT